MTTYLDSEKGGEEKEIENKKDGKGGEEGKGRTQKYRMEQGKKRI